MELIAGFSTSGRVPSQKQRRGLDIPYTQYTFTVVYQGKIIAKYGKVW